MSSKQANRAQKRAGKKEVVEEPVSAGSFVVSPSQLVEVCKTMVMGSCILKFGRKMPQIVRGVGPLSGDVRKNDPPLETNEEKTEETTDTATTGGDETTEIFDGLTARIVWHNPLGLAQPATAADSMTMWSSFKSREFDWGPVKRKKDTAAVNMNRIIENLCNNFSQYLHIFFALLMLQAFVFRSFFACLPWLFFYQNASLLIPLKTLGIAPQVPLSKCPLKFRVVATMGIHALVWFFFLYEALWRCNFIVEGLIFGVVLFHAHSVKPGAVSK